MRNTAASMVEYRNRFESGPRALLVSVLLQAVIDAEVLARGGSWDNGSTRSATRQAPLRQQNRAELIEFFRGDAVRTILGLGNFQMQAGPIQRTGLEILGEA